MPNVITTPQVLDSNTCILYGRLYRLADAVSVTRSGQFPPKQVIGDYTVDSDPFTSTIQFNDCTGGLGVYRMRSRKDSNRFWTSTCQTWKDNIITLPPLATSIANPTSVTAAVSSIVHGHNDNIYVSFGSDIYQLQSALTYSALLKALSVTPTGRPVVFNARTFYPRGGGGYTYYDGTTWTDVNNQEALHFTTWDRRIFLVESTTSTIKHSTTGNTGTWTSLSIAVDIPVGNVNGLTVYDDATGEPVVYVLTEKGPFIVDFTNTQVLPTRVQLPRNSNAGKGSRAWRDSLYFTSGLAVYQLLAGDPTIVTPVGLDRGDGVPSDQQGNIIDVVPSLSYVYFLSDATTTSNNNITAGPSGSRALGFDGFGAITTTARATGFSTIYLHDGKSNHTMFQSGLTAQAITASEVSDAFSQYRLYFGADRTVYYIDLAQGVDNPIQNTSLTYASTSTHITSWFADDNIHQPKTALRIIFECEGMSVDETIAVSYGTNQGTGWTTLGSTITSNGRTSQRFGADNDGISFRSIRFRFILSRGSTTTNRPIITGAYLEYLRNPRGVRGFSIDLDLSDISPDGQTPGEQITNIWSAITSDTLGTFSYRDDVGNTRSYLVKVVAPNGQELSGPVEGGKYKLLLAQFNDS